VGQFWTPIIPAGGSLFHADSQFAVLATRNGLFFDVLNTKMRSYNYAWWENGVLAGPWKWTGSDGRLL